MPNESYLGTFIFEGHVGSPYNLSSLVPRIDNRSFFFFHFSPFYAQVVASKNLVGYWHDIEFQSHRHGLGSPFSTSKE